MPGEAFLAKRTEVVLHSSPPVSIILSSDAWKQASLHHRHFDWNGFQLVVIVVLVF